MIDQGAAGTRRPAATGSLPGPFQLRYDQLMPALIPLSQMVDSVVVRNEVHGYQPHPSATTLLREVYKTPASAGGGNG
ncbi:Uncharacterised protein [Serratia odorifera]|uniref:Uncharacterized protein n=1 Tax=Serratia odorifera TaxID=618 RepID=A0A3S4FUB8_SEROD|nr:Uncharacterised protein [Serratia odorifera]